MSRGQRENVNGEEDNVEWRTCLSLSQTDTKGHTESDNPTADTSARKSSLIVRSRALMPATTACGVIRQRSAEVGDTSIQPQPRVSALPLASMQSVPRLCVYFVSPLRWCTPLVQCPVTVRCKCVKRMCRMDAQIFSQTHQ